MEENEPDLWTKAIWSSSEKGELLRCTTLHRLVGFGDRITVAHFCFVLLERELDLPEVKRLISLVEREVRNAVILPEPPAGAASARV